MMRSRLWISPSAMHRIANQENHTMNKWVLGAILISMAIFMYVSIIVKMS